MNARDFRQGDEKPVCMLYFEKVEPVFPPRGKPFRRPTEDSRRWKTARIARSDRYRRSSAVHEPPDVPGRNRRSKPGIKQANQKFAPARHTSPSRGIPDQNPRSRPVIRANTAGEPLNDIPFILASRIFARHGFKSPPSASCFSQPPNRGDGYPPSHPLHSILSGRIHRSARHPYFERALCFLSALKDRHEKAFLLISDRSSASKKRRKERL
jgi:hypothetical protein